MRLQTAQLQVRQLGSARINLCRAIKPNAKFVLALSGGNVLVGLGINVRIHADSDGCLLVKPLSDRIDALELRFAFHIETMDSRAQGIGNLFFGLPNACESTGVSATACFQDPKELSAGDNVESSTLASEQAEDCEVRASLHRIADQVIQGLQRSLELAEVVPDGVGRIDVHWRPDSVGQLLKVHVLAVENRVTIRKGMHGT